MQTDTAKTSYNAFVEEGSMDTKKELLYNYIKENPNCSMDECFEGTGMRQTTLWGVKKPLENENRIVKSGEKINSRSGRMVETWIVNDGTSTVQKEELGCLKNSELNKIKGLLAKANDYQKQMIQGWCN